MSNQLNRPEDFHRFLDKKVSLVQKNRIAIVGKVTAIKIDETEKTPNSIAIEQRFFRQTKVGKIRRPSGLSVATVYLKNVSRIEVL